MSIFKRGKYYHIRLKFKGEIIRRSTGTSVRQEALQLEAKLKNQLWNTVYLNKKPEKLWVEAVTRYLTESTKKTLSDDVTIIKWLEPFFKNKTLQQIDADYIEYVKSEKLKENVSAATINHYLRVITTILRKCKKWGWLHDVPTTERAQLNNKRIRWLTFEEADHLIKELPSHLAAMVSFTLATGLRSRNVRFLKWEQIDFERKHAFVDALEVKNKKALAVPLNADALNILMRQPKVNKYVFNYNGSPVNQSNTKAFKNALKRCGIKEFRWHDLRHTWASWHIQNGTSLQELQALGGWSNITMVLRYAHLSSAHLQTAADRIVRSQVGDSGHKKNTEQS